MRKLVVLFFCAVSILAFSAFVSGADPGATQISAIVIETNSSLHYDADGYVTVNWTETATPDVGISNATIWISNDGGVTYRQNGTNTSAGGFDFYGINGNWTFLIQPMNQTGNDYGNNVSYNTSWKWLVIDKTVPTSLSLESNSSSNYDTDGYVTVNWTQPAGLAPVNNYTVWINQSHGTFTQNSSTGNTSASGFDFYGATSTNNTILVSWSGGEDGSVFEGSNATWMNGSRWFFVEKVSATSPEILLAAYGNYDEGYVTFNWTAPVTDFPIGNYTLWLSTDDGVTYTQNGTNTSANGIDFYGIQANYTHAKIQWISSEDGSVFGGNNISRGGAALWLQIDKTAPTVTFTCNNALVGMDVSCSCSAVDALSGVDTTSYGQVISPYSTTVGTRTASCQVSDNVGNSGSGSGTYTITSGGGGLPARDTLPSAQHSWDNMDPSSPATMNINREGLDFTRFEIRVRNRVSDPTIKVSVLGEEPSCDGQRIGAANGVQYQYFQIDAQNLQDSDIENVTARFRINKTWVAENNINRDMAYVYRCHEGQWVGLAASAISEDAEYVHYESSLPGFSLFIIAAVEQGVAVCDNDGVCDSAQGETYDNCPDDCPVVCTPGDKQCFGDDLKQCNAEGSGWATTEMCVYGCSGGACNTAPATPLGDIILIAIIVIIAIAVLIVLKFTGVKF